MGEKKRGFTLIEVLVAITLLGIITISLLPVFVFMIRSSINEEQRFVAYQLALSQLEWLKTLDYNEELGLKKDHYQPHGIVEETLFMNENNSNPYVIDGTPYRMHTRIYWEKAQSYTKDMIANAMKKAEVTVYTRNPFTGKETKVATVGSLISFEGEREPTTPGYIEVYAFWWDRQKKESTAEKNVGVDLKGPAIGTVYSDDQGKAIFGELSPGSYTVDITSWDRGELMVQPSGVIGSIPYQKYQTIQTIEVPDWKKETTEYPSLNFYVDWPVKLSLDKYPKEAILEIQPTTSSCPLPEGTPYDFMQLSIQLQNLSKTSFWWNWQYDYRIYHEDEEYFLSMKDQEKEWDGTFQPPASRTDYYDMVLYGGLVKEGILTKENLNQKDVNKSIIIVELDTSCYVKGWEDVEFQINEGETLLSKNTFPFYDTKESFLEAVYAEDHVENVGYFIETINPSEMNRDFHKKVKIWIYDSLHILPFIEEQENSISIQNPQVLKNVYGNTIAPYYHVSYLQWK